MALPKKLKNFNVFNDAESWMGQVSEIVLPKLSRVMEEYRGAGMNGPVDVDLGQQKLEAEITLGGMVFQAFTQYAAAKADAILLRFNGAYQSDDTGQVHAMQVVLRGRYSEIDPGTAKAGEDTVVKLNMTCSYYKLTIDGVDTIELDLINGIETTGGENKLELQRLAMGLVAAL